MGNCAIVGINWGDEGKGRMVDYLAQNFDVVVRYQGGNNAGHTVINEYGKFALNLLPSGIFRQGAVNLLGAGTVIDIRHLCNEIEALRGRGVSITPDNLKISDRAIMVLPMHPMQDKWEEQRLGNAHFGSTLRGISPVYGDKYMKKAIKIGELNYPDSLREHLKLLVDWKNDVMVAGYAHERFDYNDILEWTLKYGEPLKPFICDAGELLESCTAAGKSVLFEAQLGALRDIDYGIYPFTSSSSPLAAYAPVGSGMPSISVDDVLGIVKAYSTCVGEGPFVGELSGECANALREAGMEYGAATGRPRRIAWFDMVATDYGVRLQGAKRLALTKLDVLSYLNEIPVCVGYRCDSEVLTRFPYTPKLYSCEPVYEVLEGWNCPIDSVRNFAELPRAARTYVEFIERGLNCPIEYVSVGAERESLITR